MPQPNEQIVVLAKSKIEQLREVYLRDMNAYVLSCQSNENFNILISKLLSAQQSAVTYFNCADELVGNSGLLGAHENALWATGFAEDCLAILDTQIAHYSFIREAFKKLGIEDKEAIEPIKTAFSNLHRMVSIYLPKSESNSIKSRLIKSNLPHFGFSNKAKAMTNTPTWQLIVGLIVGIVFLVATGASAVIIPNPTEWQMFIFRGIFSISLAAIAAIIPGFIDVKTKFKSEGAYVKVVSGGAIAIFVLVWFVNPPAILRAVSG